MAMDKKVTVLLLTLAGVICILSSSQHAVSPIFVWNASASIPQGLYRRSFKLSDAGSIVLVWPSPDQNKFVAQRGYLPKRVPLIKIVAGLPGQHICYRGTNIFLDGRVLVQRRATDTIGRQMPSLSLCRFLKNSEYFVLGTSPLSIDSRYFGPVLISQIAGRYEPLWIAPD